jgi:hypothetical protein
VQTSARSSPRAIAPSTLRRASRQRAVVDADRQLLVVRVPQQLEDELGQEARVGEDQRGAVAPDRRVELRDRPGRGMAAPRHCASSGSRISTSGGPRPAHPSTSATCRSRPRGPARRGRRPDRPASPTGRPAACPAQGLQPRQRQRQQIAALAGGEGVDFVDHHALQAGEQRRAFGIAEQQRQRFGRGQQDMRRAGALAGLAIGRGVAAARLDADRQAQIFRSPASAGCAARRAPAP